MDKLSQLHSYLLTSKLKIKPDDLHIYADSGTVESAVGSKNKHFSAHYNANVIITNYSGDAATIFYMICEFMNQYQPNRDNKSIQFDMDILSNGSVDLSFTLPLSEIQNVSIADDGIIINSYPEPDMEEQLANALGFKQINTSNQNEQ